MKKIKIDDLINEANVPHVSDEQIARNWEKVQAKLDGKGTLWLKARFIAFASIMFIGLGLSAWYFLDNGKISENAQDVSQEQNNALLAEPNAKVTRTENEAKNNATNQKTIEWEQAQSKMPNKNAQEQEKNPVTHHYLPKSKTMADANLAYTTQEFDKAKGANEKNKPKLNVLEGNTGVQIATDEISKYEETNAKNAEEVALGNNANKPQPQNADAILTKSNASGLDLVNENSTTSALRADSANNTQKKALVTAKKALKKDSFTKVNRWSIEAGLILNPEGVFPTDVNSSIGIGLNFRYGISNKNHINLGAEYVNYHYANVQRVRRSQYDYYNNDVVYVMDSMSASWSRFVRVPILYEREVNRLLSYKAGVYAAFRRADYGDYISRQFYRSGTSYGSNTAIGLDLTKENGFTNSVVSNQQTLATFSHNFMKPELRKFDIGLMAGVNYRFGKKLGWTVSAQGSLGFLDFTPNSIYNSPQKRNVNSSFEFSLAKTIYTRRKKVKVK